jgi:hypothetical protein
MNFFTYYGVGAPGQGYFNFYPAQTTTPALSINSNGNIGIGTTTPPAYKLDVAGAIRSSSGGIYFPDGSQQTTAFIPSNSQIIVGSVGASAGDYTLNTNGLWVGDSQYGLNADDGTLRLLNLVAAGSIAFRINQVATPGATPALTDAMTVSGTGNVGIGTTNPGATLEVNGNVKLTSGSGASITFQDGTVQSSAYTGILPGGDYADSVDVIGDRKKYEAGDLLVIDSAHPGKFLKSAEPYSTSVAGIFSTKPGTVGRRQTGPKNPDEVPMAMVGIVPTKVTAENGPIHPGDLLVTSSTLGYAMKGTDRSRMLGAVVGKALGSLDSGTGVVEVVVTLQ